MNRAAIVTTLAPLLLSTIATAQVPAPPTASAPAPNPRLALQRELAAARSADAALPQPLRARLAAFGLTLLPRSLAQAAPDQRVRAILRQCRPGRSAVEHRALLELLAQSPTTVAPLRRAARIEPAPHRRLAALSALILGDEAERPFALDRALLDRSPTVRQAIVRELRATAAADDVAHLSKRLRHRTAAVRVRAVEALARLGHPSAVDALIAAAPTAATGLRAGDQAASTRGHVAFVRQVAYARDFDVEVASAAFIADPSVDVVQDGAVLDATIAGTVTVRTIRRSYRAALRKLTGSDPGRDPSEWPQWRARQPR